MNQVHFSSDRQDWATPQAFFDEQNRKWKFTLDVCATPANAKCQRFFTPEDNGLEQPWNGRCWMNPPYGREIGAWMCKAFHEWMSERAEIVVCLVPARTDTAWWHDFAMKGQVEFIRGRLTFVGATSPAPFPSALAVFA